MIAILEKYEHNVDFHPIVDFVEASHIRRNLKLNDEARISSLPDAELFENLALMGRDRIAQSSALPTVVDEPASPFGDDSQGKACPIVSGLEAEQDRVNIIKTSTLPHDSPAGVTSLVADEGIKYKWSVFPMLQKLPLVVTPYSRRKEKEKMVESDTPKKKKLQEHIDVQEYEQFAEYLSIGERIELINDLVKYQDNYAKFPRMSLEEIREKFIPVWKQIEDFVPMGSKEEGERVKRKGLKLEQESSKKVKTSEEVSEEDLKTMMHLVLVKEVYVEALQVKHLIIDWEIHTKRQRTYWKIIRLGGNTAVYQFFVDMLKHFNREDLNQLWTLVRETLSIRQATGDKEKELWVELKRLYEPDVKEKLWTQTQTLMHDPRSRNLHVGREGLPIEEGTSNSDDKQQAPSIPTANDEFPLPEDFPTANEERFPLLSQKDATAEEVCTADEVKCPRLFQFTCKMIASLKSEANNLPPRWRHT
nr:hypothetical protein [Tanacetum cinerariifolium]